MNYFGKQLIVFFSSNYNHNMNIKLVEGDKVLNEDENLARD